MKLFTARSHSSDSRGFTLIEMLIVIALIAALAVGVLATLDPLDRIRQGRDQSLIQASSALNDGVTDYVTVSSAFPFTGALTAFSLTSNVGNAAYIDAIAKMNASGSLKDTFNLINSSVRGAILITVSTANETIFSCFAPGSKKYKSDAVFNSSGAAGTTHYCIK